MNVPLFWYFFQEDHQQMLLLLATILVVLYHLMNVLFFHIHISEGIVKILGVQTEKKNPSDHHLKNYVGTDNLEKCQNTY